MQGKNIATAFAVLVLIIVLTVGTIFYQNKSLTSLTAQDSKPPEVAYTNSQRVSYKDGTYSANGVYTTPDNQEEIGITITLVNGVITDAVAKEKAILSTSKNFQEEFINNFKPMVVGKNIADLKLNKVAGSSLTPKGFNDALTKIKEQAKV